MTSKRQILIKTDVELQNRALPKFQILVSESKIDLYSKIENGSPKSKPLIPLESRFETSKFEFSALDLVRIEFLEFFFNQNLDFVLGCYPSRANVENCLVLAVLLVRLCRIKIEWLSLSSMC